MAPVPNQPPHEPERARRARPPSGLDPTLQPGSEARPASGSTGARDDLTGQLLGGKYRVLRLLGEGGFGAVYEATDELLGAHVAIKVLNQAASERQDALQRFLGEARLLTTLDHPNVVRWITFDRTPQGLHYFVMEFLRGRELSKLLESEGRLAPARAIALLQQILSALRAAHSLPDGRSLLHLDLKPRNVFVVEGEPEQAKVIDFGMSQHVGAAARGEASAAPGSVPGSATGSATRPDADLGATISGVGGTATPRGRAPVRRALGGTLLYASPEQIRHLTGAAEIVELDGRSDLYSLGVMAFELLAGRLPWNCATYAEAVRAQLELPPPKLASLGLKLPRGLDAFVERCLAKDRDHRFADVREAQAALQRVATPPSRWPAVTAVLAVVAALATWLAWPDAKPDPLELAAPGGAIFVSPERRTATLPLGNLQPALRGAAALWVVDRQAEGDALPQWRTELREAAGTLQLALTAPESAQLLDYRALHLRVGSRERGQFAAPVRIVHLPPSAWRIEAAGVRGAQGRVVDPLGAALEIALRVPDRAFVAGVEVSCGATKRSAELDATQTDPALAVYALPLEALGLAADAPPGNAAIAIVARDRAGNEQARDVDLTLDGRPLQLAARLEGHGCLATAPDEYVVYPGAAPVLTWQSSREVKVTLGARDARGTAVDLTPTARPAGGGLALAFPAREASYSLVLEVSADDRESTAHRDLARGAAKRTLRARYETKAVRVDVAAFDGDAPLPKDGDVWLARGERVALELQRDLDVPVTLQIEHRGPAQASERREVALHGEARARPEFALVAGRHVFAIAAYRYAGPGAALGEPELRREIVVECDRRAPTLQVTRAPNAVVRQLGRDDACVEFVRDEPAAVRWQLSRGAEAASAREGELRIGAAAGTLRWRDLWPQLDGPIDGALDGDYALALTALDAAGNASPSATATFTLAREGPRLTLAAPAGAQWLPRAGNVFAVEVDASDDNGVQTVQCRVASDDGAAVPTLTLRADRERPTRARFVGEVTLPVAWAKRSVQLVCLATDAYGNAAQSPTFATALPAFELQRAPVIWLQLTGSTAATQPMRFVRGEEHYVFGGRADETEALRTIGLAHKLPGDQRIEGVADFYLDENEVTVADYLAFVRDPDGYRQAGHWDKGAPVAARQRALVERLQQLDGALPVTEIDWFEASAYARFAGKRLPTDVEWEYAVRGGTAYRACSCAGPGFDASALNVRRGGAGGAWPIGRGIDVTPDGVGAGLRNLCSNVTEWTSEPGRNNRRRAVGASFAHESFHFAIIEPHPPETRRASLGFRCAATATDLDAILERPARVRITFTPPPSQGR